MKEEAKLMKAYSTKRRRRRTREKEK